MSSPPHLQVCYRRGAIEDNIYNLLVCHRGCFICLWWHAPRLITTFMFSFSPWQSQRDWQYIIGWGEGFFPPFCFYFWSGTETGTKLVGQLLFKLRKLNWLCLWCSFIINLFKIYLWVCQLQGGECPGQNVVSFRKFGCNSWFSQAILLIFFFKTVYLLVFGGFFPEKISQYLPMLLQCVALALFCTNFY